MKYYIAIMIVSLLIGCTPMGDTDINELHDDRVNIGCLAVSLEGKTKWVSPASGELAKAFCSNDLPDCFEFHYDRNGLKVNVITPCEVDITDE